jgi:hypothetical protein
MVRSDSGKSYLSELVSLSKRNLVAIGYEKITITTPASSFTVPADAKYALCVLESTATGIAVRYLELGGLTLPTTTTGLPRSNGDSFDIQGAQNLTNFRAIQAQAGTHVLNVVYYK